jgi:threonyl-tRNA synthetase
VILPSTSEEILFFISFKERAPKSSPDLNLTPTVSDSTSLHNELSESGIRSGIDTRSERMNAKVRDAQINKIPYMFLVGDREVESETVGVRLRSGEDLGALSLNEMKKRISSEVEGKIT